MHHASFLCFRDADLTKKLNELEGEIANLKSVFGGDKDSVSP